MVLSRRPQIAFPGIAAALACGSSLLSGCAQSEHSAFAPRCPPVEILSEAADYFDYAPQRLDLGGLKTHATIRSLTGNCAAGDKKSVRTKLSMKLTVDRGPASDSTKVTVPYFVAVLHDGKIVDKKRFTTQVVFKRNQNVVPVRTAIKIIDVPAAPDIQETNYALSVGFQLTRDQLRYNKSHLPPAAFKPLSE